MSGILIAATAMLAAISGALTKGAFDRRRSKREAVTLRRELEELRASSEKLRAILAQKGESEWQDGEIVLLEGKLVIEGEGLAPPRRARALRGKKIAASARFFAPTRWPRGGCEGQKADRAERLYLESAAGRVLLEGALSLANGTHRIPGGLADSSSRVDESRPEQDRISVTLWYETTFVLTEGDDVLALGCRRAKGDGGYRDAGSSVLTAAPAVGGIRIAASRS